MIKIKNLSVSIRKKEILKDVNIEFEKGKIYGIIGPNGAGKSTLLKKVMRINEPEENRIFLNGKDIKKFSTKDYSKQVAFVFQENSRDIDFTVEEIVMMGRYPYIDFLGSETKEDVEIVNEVLQKLGIEKFKGRYISELSGGEAQKVFIARALVQKTNILLLDEPTSMLDIHNSVEIMNLIEMMKKEKDLTVIMVLHDLNIAFAYCDELVLMNEGKIVIANSKEKIIESRLLEDVYKEKIKIIEHEEFEYTVSLKK
ncbi:MAG: ABC transporter ATP-binding protein [Sarcina sp.]